MYDFGLGGATASVIGARIVSSAKECRANASECLDLARKAKSDAERDTFMKMAATWLRAAVVAELAGRTDNEKISESSDA